MPSRQRVYESDNTGVDRAIDLALRRKQANAESAVVASSGYFSGGASDPSTGSGGSAGSAHLDTIAITVAPAATEVISLGEYFSAFFAFSQLVDDPGGNDFMEAGFASIFRNAAGAVQLGRTSHESSGVGTSFPNAGWVVALSGDDLQLSITNSEANDLIVKLTVIGRHT